MTIFHLRFRGMGSFIWLRSAAGLFAGLIALGLPSSVLATDDPVVADVRDGPCRMVVSGKLAILSIHVEGLRPGEPILFESVSNGERMVRQTQAKTDGTYYATLLASVEGYETGTDTVTIQGSRCTLVARFPWSINE